MLKFNENETKGIYFDIDNTIGKIRNQVLSEVI
jgi:hypothetical protein